MAGQLVTRAGALLLSTLAVANAVDPQPNCRHIPGDAGWPSLRKWAQLNETVGGRLISTIPQAHVCHDEPFGQYNKTACDELSAEWNFRYWKFTVWEMGQTHVTKASEILNPYYQNASCDPFTPREQPCELGNYAVYSINVTGVDDVRAGLEFARKNNVRLTIKNTGHDYHGRSSGQGSLALWTYNLKSAEVIDRYESPMYTGPAAKLGAGMGVGESYMAVHAKGYRIVGGECGTVGVAGGYSQGGGHSVLASKNGLGADQVLQWEVVTPTGEHLFATPEKNSDLYWALSGGGGGTYGVVLSVTVRVHRDGPFAGGSLVFKNEDTPGHEIYWKAVELFFQFFPNITVDGNTAQFVLLNDTLDAQAINLPGRDVDAVYALMNPYLRQLDDLGVKYVFKTTYSDTYYEHFDNYYGPLPNGAEPVTTILYARLVPKWVIKDPEANRKLIDAYRSVVKDGKWLLGCGVLNLEGLQHPDNAVLPAWRTAQAVCIANGFWNFRAPVEENVALKRELADIHAPAMDAATPGTGIYVNEVDPMYKGNWKEDGYGANYERLLRIKHKYDPHNLLYGHFSVGGDEFSIDGSGRLCYEGPQDSGHLFGGEGSQVVMGEL
ncbi:putative FAD-dependent isoamyl alcohol oxidase [Durotheca rogersii]|uniref:putative FAD-dependent isoamyl alcohol oxidase n=1 Tax=Durotheca rogersii TaxID=419775 RepID=UPI002220BB0D|nr:putative FAD-dependent isoamyl alcohol oxidase [Durotheca rogersii]KAI5865325.1 putative FAD-dependent isoamyl alcohol oxidase [Durotheca rogersii]